MGTITILGLVGGFIATILAFIFIIPESKLSQLNHPVLVFLHNLFNFKSLWIEKILKFFYTFLTITSVVYGFFMLFQVNEVRSWNYYTGNYTVEKEWAGYYGLAVMIVAPVIIRIAYELLMMTVLLVKNTIEINNKLGKQPAATAYREEAPKREDSPVREAAPKREDSPVREAAPQGKCCPKCGHHIAPDSTAIFCTNCGSSLDM